MDGLVEQFVSGDYLNAIESSHLALSQVKTDQSNITTPEIIQIWNAIVNFKNDRMSAAAKIIPSAQRALNLMHELACMALDKSSTRADTATKLVHLEVLIGSCEEFSKQEKERPKSRLFYEKARHKLGECRRAIMNVIERGKCETLECKLAVLSVLLEDKVALPHMKPASWEMFAKVFCDAQIAPEKVIRVVEEMRCNGLLSCLVCLSQIRLLNVAAEAYFATGNFAESLQTARNSFAVDPNMEALFWILKCNGMMDVSMEGEELFKMLSKCMPSSHREPAEAVLMMIEAQIGVQELIKFLAKLGGADSLKLKMLLKSRSLCAEEKANHVLAFDAQRLKSDELALDIEELFERLFKQELYPKAIEILKTLSKMFDPSNEHYRDNMQVIERKRVDCLLAMAHLEEAESVITKNSQIEASWVIRGFELRLRKGQEELAELCFEQLLVVTFVPTDECLYCVSVAQRLSKRQFSMKLLMKLFKKVKLKDIDIAALKSFISLCCEFPTGSSLLESIDVLEECFLLCLTQEKNRDTEWLLGASWSLSIHCMNEKNYKAVQRFITIAKSFVRKEDTVDAFVLLYFELIALLEIPNEHERICDILQFFNEKRTIVAGLAEKSCFFSNVDVNGLLTESPSLQLRIALYQNDFQAARSIIESAKCPETVVAYIKLAVTLAESTTDELVDAFAEQALRVVSLSKDILFIARSLLLLLNSPESTFIVNSIIRMLQKKGANGDHEDETDDEIVWIIVYMHNTSLDLYTARKFKEAIVWSEGALTLCSQLGSSNNQVLYEKAVRAAFLKILAHN